MQIFIPLRHQTKNNRIPVLLEKPFSYNESFLTLVIPDGCEDDYAIEIGPGGGSANAEKIFLDAKRMDNDNKATDPEFYTQRGQDIATSLKFSKAEDYLAAWQNEIDKQVTLCGDIHTVLSFNILPKLPRWIRMDVFSLLESEAMKQVFAAEYFQLQPDQKLPFPLQNALRNCADGHPNHDLSALMEELFEKPFKYKNSAENFVTNLKLLQNI